MTNAHTVIVLNSFVAAGAVGGRVSAFVLESLGFRVVAVPTVLLSWHPGVGPATRVVPDRFESVLADLAGAPWLGEVVAVLSGYLGAAGQADPVAGLVDAVQAANPAAVFLCDPVIGDRGGLYVPEATAAAIRDRLAPRADVVTPNTAELSWLADGRVAPLDIAGAKGAADALGISETVVTSLPAGTGRIGAAVFGPEGTWRVCHPALVGETKGAGDLFAARYLASRLDGSGPGAALRVAAAAAHAFVQAAHGTCDGALPLAGNAGLLAANVSQVVLERP